MKSHKPTSLINLPCIFALFNGDQGSRSDESVRLPPMWPGLDSGLVPYVS